MEDSSSDAKLIISELRRSGQAVEFERVESADGLRKAIAASRPWDVIICDWTMPSFDALAALSIVKKHGLDVPFIIVSGTMGEENAVDAVRAGAHDYVLKDKLKRLQLAVEREIREFKSREAHRQSERRLKQSEEALRESEMQLRQAQKMEAVGRLAGGVAHDFNNALSVILTYGELVLATLPADDPNREDIEEIRKAGQRAAGLTRQLLMFSRQHVLEPRAVNLNEVLGGMRKLLGRVLNEDVDLIFELHSSPWMTLVDPASFEHVIMNLFVNARDAMPGAGKVTVRTDNVSIDEGIAHTDDSNRVRDYVLVSVTDTGIGMDERTLSRIFDPFFTTKDKGKGTGLGLSTVFGIVEQSGGKIRVFSEVGAGSTFQIYLPRTDAPAAALRPSRSPGRSVGSETILLVEDEEPLRAMLESVLRRQGYTVVSATDGADALRRSEQYDGSIHLLLTDVVMPHMRGPELARELVARRPGLRVLFMSGHTEDSVLRHGLADGDVAFLSKPVTPSILGQQVRALLDGAEVSSHG